MNINLSEIEIRALLVALEHTQNFQNEDANADDDAYKSAPGTQAWLDRKFAAEDLSDKLTNALESKAATAERMMKGTVSPTIEFESLYPNDPVNW